MKNNFITGLYFIMGIITSCLCLEGIFRLLPVESGLGNQEMSRFGPVIGGEPGRHFVFCRDWNFAMLTRGTINSDGFIANKDYPSEGSEVNLIIGDSFIEAAMIDSEQSVQGLLSEKYNAVGLGISGGDLATYLFFLEKGLKLWKVKNVVIVISENDFLTNFDKKTGLPHFEKTSDGLTLVNGKMRAKESKFKQKQREVKSLRYIVGQLKLWPSSFINLIKTKELRINDNAISQKEKNQQLKLNKDAIDYFISRLSNLVGEDVKVLFLVNGVLDSPYVLNKESKLKENTVVFVKEALESGFKVIDVYPHMHRHSVKNKKKMRWIRDGHWTPAGHLVVSEIVEDWLQNN